MTFVLPKQTSFYNSGILNSFFTVTICNVWTSQMIYFDCITYISAMSTQDILHFIRMWITILIISARPPPAHFLLTNREYWWKRQCMEWRGYIYFTCKQPIFIYWNYRWDFRKFDRYRSWSSRIISSHCWSTPHSIIQK